MCFLQGFSQGCGSCGELDHSFENCFMHNMVAEQQELTPAARSGEAENARQTKLLLARQYMSSQGPRQAPQRRANLISNNTITASQRQQQAFQRRTLPSPPSVPLLQEAPSSSDGPKKVEQHDNLGKISPQLINKMHQMAIMLESPQFQALGAAKTPTGGSSSHAAEEGKIAPKRKEEKMPVEALELAAADDETPFDTKGKGKAIATSSPTKHRNKKQRRNNGGALTIHGCEEN